MIWWIITWILLVANLTVAVFRNIKIREEAQRAMQGMERRLRDSAAVRKTLGKTYDERLADEYRKRGLSG